MFLYDGLDSGDRSILNIQVVDGLVTEREATGSFGSVNGLPSLGDPGSFILSGLPTLSIAWNAPNGGLSSFTYDTGGETRVNSTPVPEPSTLLCLAMGAISMLGLHLRQR